MEDMEYMNAASRAEKEGEDLAGFKFPSSKDQKMGFVAAYKASYVKGDVIGAAVALVTFVPLYALGAIAGYIVGKFEK